MLGAQHVAEVAAGKEGAEVSLRGAMEFLEPRVGTQVGVHFFFLSLLHLANEHGLALEAVPVNGKSKQDGYGSGGLVVGSDVRVTLPTVPQL